MQKAFAQRSLRREFAQRHLDAAPRKKVETIRKNQAFLDFLSVEKLDAPFQRFGTPVG
jgi:hypothetical protein